MRSVLLVLTVGLLAAADEPKNDWNRDCDESQREKPYTSPEGKFQVNFPFKPMIREKFDGALVQYIVDAVPVACAVMVGKSSTPADAKPEEVAKALDKIRNAATKNTKSRLISEKEVKLNGKHPGRECVITFAKNKSYGRYRTFLVGAKDYQVLVVGESEVLLSNKTSTAFLDSFQIKE